MSTFTIDTIEQLVREVTLVEVVPYEIAGRRVATDVPASNDASSPSGPTFQLDARLRVDSGAFETRFRVKASNSQVEAMADFSAAYRLSPDASIPEDVMQDFVARVAFMTVYPFLREAVATTAARLKVDLPELPLVKAGELQLHRAADT